MDDCERWFGALSCRSVGEGKCAFAVNEALNEGDVVDREGFLNALRGWSYEHVLRVFVVHSIDFLTDPEVRKFIPISYSDCVARNAIADAAKTVLMEKLESDEFGDINVLGRITFDLPIDD